MEIAYHRRMGVASRHLVVVSASPRRGAVGLVALVEAARYHLGEVGLVAALS